jgi:hypothetical protein
LVSTSEKKIKELESVLAEKETEAQVLSEMLPREMLPLVDEIAGFPKAAILPLSDNLVVSHAIQLSFDPDIREFVCDAAFIEQSESTDAEKKQLLMVKMQEILPKIKQYLFFIMKGGEYPSLRGQKIYSPVRKQTGMV